MTSQGYLGYKMTDVHNFELKRFYCIKFHVNLMSQDTSFY